MALAADLTEARRRDRPHTSSLRAAHFSGRAVARSRSKSIVVTSRPKEPAEVTARPSMVHT